VTLKGWEANGWLRPHKTSRQEIANLLAIVRRDLTDARSDAISDDWRFGIAPRCGCDMVMLTLETRAL
jgi:hypothetical protein